MERHHTYKVLGWTQGGWPYEIYKDGVLVKTSKPFQSRDLAIAKANEEACELDNIWD